MLRMFTQYTVLMVLAAGVWSGCTDGPEHEGCEDGEILSGEDCIAVVSSDSQGVDAGTTDTTGGATSNGTSDGTTGDAPDPTMVTLPFAVDDFYGPSGYMGDGETAGGLVAGECNERADGAVGNCHRFTWNPGEAGFAGIYWQYPDGNWGDAPGLEIPAGATQVSVQAWGAEGGEQVRFAVGIQGPDGFNIEGMTVTLTDTPTEYTLDLSGITYTSVVGGFAWFADSSEDPVVFSVDDIQWE